MNYTFRAEVTKPSLDLLFISNYGKRNPSPIIETLQDEYGSVLTNEELSALAAVIVEMYKEKWDKLAEIYDLQYDPIHNYLDEWEDTSDEAGTRTLDSDATRTDVHGHQISDNNTRTDNLTQTTDTTIGTDGTRTDNLSETNNTTTTNEGLVNQEMNTYGFNSSTEVPRDATHETHEDEDVTQSTRTNTGTVTNSEDQDIDSTVHNTGTRTDARSIINSGTDTRDTDLNEDETTSHTRDRSGKHEGNIGNITTQKMIREELELWKWNYVQTILDDVKDFCTIPVYLNYPIAYESEEET